MAGYIGSKSSVTQVDGYNRTEADGRYVNASGDTMTGALGIGTAPATSPSTMLHVREDDSVDHIARIAVQSADQMLVAGSKWQAGVEQYSFLKSTNAAETVGQPMRIQIGDNTALGIDSAGRVTMPYQPSWSLQPTSTFGSGATDPIPFGVGGSNKTFANGVSVNAGTVTVPVAGKYFVSCMVRQEGQQTWMELIMKVNGVSIARGGVWYTSSEYETVHSSRVLDLQANDTVSMRMNTGTATFNGNSDTLTFFEGHLIG